MADAGEFTRGGMLFLEPPQRWARWNRNVWKCGASRRATWLCARCVETFEFAGEARPRFCPYCRCTTLFEEG